ncbi:hypothetical protein D0962_11545 [Leptolyngbyaceae cyanobacterium CCMR0082]|uniref:Uncharacterized protein n=1 Tax=Adonisia turfae CCMR0082 TaxID=2304604 RepID=A0A6M0S5Q9_9CYAN|nr:hypothetical protein [Adonisia turfae CCMR0082]
MCSSCNLLPGSAWSVGGGSATSKKFTNVAGISLAIAPSPPPESESDDPWVKMGSIQKYLQSGVVWPWQDQGQVVGIALALD